MRLYKDPKVLFTKKDWVNSYIIWIPHKDIYRYMKYVDGEEVVVYKAIPENVLRDTDFFTVNLKETREKEKEKFNRSKKTKNELVELTKLVKEYNKSNGFGDDDDS